MALRFEAIRNPDFVARVTNVDLRKPLSDGVRDEIISGLDKYAVLVFPDQPISAEEQVDFSLHFGTLDTGLQTKVLKKFQNRLGNDAVSDISNVEAGTDKVAPRSSPQTMMNVGNSYWHSDSSYEHLPRRYSILAAQAAVSWGGATEYADLRAAYDALDERTKALISDKVATFYANFTRLQLGIQDPPDILKAYPPVQWPMIRTHPGSGRKVLWVDNKVCEISGMSIPEGRLLAHELIEHIGQRERVYSHFWKAGDVVMYDNRSVLHRGRRFDLSERREMRRTQIKDTVHSLGEVPDKYPVAIADAGDGH
jgi:alpha-ketoglutarate-dependent 2,4-dichlorophenoxyacetate dioxygenase